MSYDEFWNGDVELARYSREAWRLGREVRNQELWLQGAYFYEAMLDAAPMLHAFAKKGTKPTPYRDAPFEIFQKKVKDGAARLPETQQEKNDKKAKAVMEMMMISINRKFEAKGGGSDGGKR